MFNLALHLRSRIPRVLLCLIPALMAVAASCSSPYSPLKPKVADLPKRPLVALKVGILYGAELTTDDDVRKNPFGKVGISTRAMFDMVFASVFARTVPMDTLPPPNGAVTRIDAVLETRLESSFYYRAAERQHVAYRFILYSPAGRPVHTWVVRSDARNWNFFNVDGYVEAPMVHSARLFVAGVEQEFRVAAPRLLDMDAIEREASPSALVEASLERAPPVYTAKGWKMLRSSDFVPLRVRVTNITGQRLNLTVGNLWLETADKRRVAPMPPALLPQAVDYARGQWIRVGAAEMENITVAEDLNYELSVFSPNKRQAAWDAVNRALTAASLQDQILDPGQRAEGLLIFRLPPETGSVAVTLGGWLSDGEARPLSIRSEAAVPLNRAKWKPTPEVRCSRFDDTRVIGEFQITTGPPVWSSTSSSHLSHTSGCEKEPADPDDAQAYRFISAMDSGLMAEAAQAQGPRVTALASLMGCDEGARSGFVELMRMRFDTIYPDAWPRPDVVLNTLRVEMEHDAVLATCRPGMLFTEPSLTP